MFLLIRPQIYLATYDAFLLCVVANGNFVIQFWPTRHKHELLIGV